MLYKFEVYGSSQCSKRKVQVKVVPMYLCGDPLTLPNSFLFLFHRERNMDPTKSFRWYRGVFFGGRV